MVFDDLTRPVRSKGLVYLASDLPFFLASFRLGREVASAWERVDSGVHSPLAPIRTP